MITLKKKFEDIDSFVINKKVILRVDLNLPSYEGEIVDFTRLEKISPTIKYLLKRGIAVQYHYIPIYKFTSISLVY